MDIIMDRTARKHAPIRKLPVKSLMAPMMNGPANPPISATQKNIPPADPMYLEPISGMSINISIRSGIIAPKDTPYNSNPVIRGLPDAVATIITAIAVAKAIRATMRPLNRGATKRGTTKTVGKLTKTGMEDAKPAIFGDKPPVSRILGSQLLKP